MLFRSFRHPPAADEIGKLLASVELFPERTHVVGAYALGKAQRLIALLRAAGWDKPIYVHGATAECLLGYYDQARSEQQDIERARALHTEIQKRAVFARHWGAACPCLNSFPTEPQAVPHVEFEMISNPPQSEVNTEDL